MLGVGKLGSVNWLCSQPCIDHVLSDLPALPPSVPS